MPPTPADPHIRRNFRIESTVLDEIKGHFRPELLNRLDEQIVFRKLAMPEVRASLDPLWDPCCH